MTVVTPRSLIQRFASDLSALRDAADPPCPSLREISTDTGIPVSTLHTALQGKHLPTREVVVALVAGLGGDVMAWQLRRAELEEALAALSGGASRRKSGRRPVRR